MLDLFLETLFLFGIISSLIVTIYLLLGETQSPGKKKVRFLIITSPAISYFIITPLISLFLAMDIQSFFAFGFLVTILLMAYLVVIERSIEDRR